jgi:putative ABC transport system substrate-binding protein
VRRREFITLLGGAAVAWPRASRAQQAALPVIGFIYPASPGPSAHVVRAFRQGLGETGYVEGQNVMIEYRWAEDQFDRIPALVADLVRRQVAVIAAITGTISAREAKAATTTIPIVFQTGLDPVAIGLVESLSHPGGNLTGVATLNVELGPKRLELLREVVPAATTIGLLINPKNLAAESLSRDMLTAARSLGLQLHVLHASAEDDFDRAFASLAALRAGALMIGADAFFNGQSERLAALTLRHALPAIFQYREFVAAGGLLSYGADNADMYRQVGVYTGRILHGERPVDLPVAQSTKVELIINLKTAKALGLTVPLALLGRADEVIE